MLRIIVTSLLTTLLYHSAIGQNGFNKSFEFLEIPGHTILAGLGGVNISLNDKDVNLLSGNPSLVGESLDKHLSLSYILYPGDIKISNATYVAEVGSTGSWGVNVRYFNYGDMQGYDATGAPTGEFSANEFAFTLSKSHQVGNYRIGTNLKYAYSGIAGYFVSAMVMDLGGVFIHPEKDVTAGLVIKNAGIVISDFTKQKNSGVPLDVQVGTSFKPTHMPVRFSFTIYDLTQWDNISEEATESGIIEPGGIDKFFRHTIFGTQFLIGQNVELLAGYNHKKRRELKLDESSFGASGFSYGILFGIKAFKFGFSRHGYHVGGVSNTFTLTSDLGRWIMTKRSVTE